ncbi:MAG: molybdate ABC transporter substrate-binding protein [Armatimonadia bacterium]
MSRNLLGLLLVSSLVLALAGCQRPKPAEVAPTPVAATPTEIRAFIPCGMIIPMRTAADAFMKERPGLKITGIYDNAGVIVKRIADKGEQADLVVTPGSVELKALQDKGHIAGEAKPIGTFELVVIVPRDSKLDLKTPADLKKCKTIGSANPETNSTGASGKQALTKLGLWDALQPKFLKPYPDHAIVAYNMVASGKADAAIAYKNCPLETNPDKLSKTKVRVAFSFPAESYTKQQCLVAMLTGSKNSAAAQQFVDYLTSAKGLKVLSESGMAGCLDLASCPAPGTTAPAAAAPAADRPIKLVAYYPNNEGHAKIKKLIEGLPAKYPRVSAEFVDFTSDKGYERWQAAGMTCGGILINDEQTFSYDKGGKPVEVTFKMGIGGEWTEADLYAVLAKLSKEAK